ncbi:ABC transporter substrate-binding protein [Syntrophobotulus glycolicus]|nr:ABC transporter substrate-binding protein [Syntrophobotulus glycolicus]
MKKLIAVFLMVILGAGFVAGCGKSSSPAGENTAAGSKAIQFGISAYPSWYVWFIAKEEKIFEKYGLNVNLVWFPTYSDSTQAFLTGNLDFVSLALSDTVAPYVKGEGHKIVLINDYSNGADGLVAAPDIKSVQDLKGKTVATEYGTIEHFFLLRLLEQNNMTESDIDFTNMTISDSGVAFLSGSVDAASLWEPALSKAQGREGTNTLYTSRQTPGLIPSVLVANQNYIAGNEENTEKLIQVWFDALKFYQDNPDKALEDMAKSTEISVEEMKVAMSGSKLYSLQDNLDAMTKQSDSLTYIPYTTRITADFLYGVKLIEKKADDYTALFDPAYLQKVSKLRASEPAPDTELK